MLEHDLASAALYRDFSPQGPTVFYGVLIQSQETKGAIALFGVYGIGMSEVGEMVNYVFAFPPELDANYRWLVEQYGKAAFVSIYFPEGTKRRTEHDFVTKDGKKKTIVMSQA